MPAKSQLIGRGGNNGVDPDNLFAFLMEPPVFHFQPVHLSVWRKDQIIVSGNIQEQPDGPDNNEYCKVIQTEQTYKQTYNQVDPLKKLPGLFCLLTDPLYIRTGKAAPWDMDAMNHSFFVFS